MVTKLSKLENIEEESLSFDDMNADAVRRHVMQATRNFKNSWRNLAQALHVVWREKLYRKWGYDKFDQYTAKEVRIRKHTAMKLIRSYMFLEQEEPLYLKEADAPEGPKILPSIDAVNLLQRAKKNLDEKGYQKIKDDLFNKERDVREVKKDLTALVFQRRKDLDPEQERTKSGKVSVERFVSKLKAFRYEVEALHILPGYIADEIDKLIKKIKDAQK